MTITSIDAHLLESPLQRPVAAAISARNRGSALTTIFMPIVFVSTDEGLTGLGYAWPLGRGGTTMLNAIKHDLAPALIGEAPLDHERLWQNQYWQKPINVAQAEVRVPSRERNPWSIDRIAIPTMVRYWCFAAIRSSSCARQ